MSKRSALEELSVSELIYKFDIIVPEIQREYVWGFNYNSVLQTFIDDIKEARNQTGAIEASTNLQALKGLLDKADENTKASILQLINQEELKSNSLNIGFLYSYKPSYYFDKDRNSDVFLIDGQQRFTTLFLMLFYFSMKENKQAEFKEQFKYIQNEESIAFDYRVRVLTHNFIIDLMDNIETIEDLIDITDKRWFLNNYKGDTTITAIVGNEKQKIEGVFKTLHINFDGDNVEYFEFINKHIKFWHFNSDETSQGEELYITMNSRGQQLADNENLRAKLFEDVDDKLQLEWSQKWEEWQDFFWKHRNKGERESSADAGFNEFIRWITIISIVENGHDDKSELYKLALKDKLELKFLLQHVSLEKIEIYFYAVRKLFTELNFENFKSKFQAYNNWDLTENYWLYNFSKDKTNRLKSGLTLIALYRLLPILKYIADRKDKPPSDVNIFRLIRFVFNTTNIDTIGKTPDTQIVNVLKMIDLLDVDYDVCKLATKEGVSKTILNEEERRKLDILSNHNDDERIELEDMFWSSEDYRYNNGSILHLLNWSIEVNDESEFRGNEFKNIWASYQEIMSNDVLIWGDLINTDVYVASEGRIVFREDYHKRNGIKYFTINYALQVTKDLTILMQNSRKEFIKKYDSVEAVYDEVSSKAQLYFYYILNQSTLVDVPPWNWGDRFNFGVIYDDYYDWYDVDAESIFYEDYSYIYQRFKKRFAAKPEFILDLQKEYHLINDEIIEELFDYYN